MTERFDVQRRRIQWIPVGKISVVWAQAQQPFDEKHAKDIASAFDPDMFDPIKVTKANGSGQHHAIDGQHRRAAVEMLFGPQEKVPCEVLDADDPVRAAELFGKINTMRKRPQPLSIFKVQVTAGDETAVAVSKIAQGLGYRIENSHQDRNIMAVAALVSIYRRHGPEILENTLKLIQATWGVDPNAVVGPILRGYAEFLVEHGQTANWQRVKEVILKRYTPGRFVAAAKTAREMTGGNMAEAIKKLIVSNYNNHYRGAHLKD